jgi:class 3 adenylate cyclase
MNDLEPKKTGLAAKLPDILAFIASLGVFTVAYLIFTNKIPKVYLWIYQHFYLIAVVGILGFLGEKLSVTLLTFLIPLALGGSTLAFLFQPQKYAIEEWWEIYARVVLFATGFLVFLFIRFEQTKKLKGESKDLGARVDPAAAARYRAEIARKEAAEKGAAVPAGDDEGGRGKLKKKKDVAAEPIDPNETPEQRMEREMRQLKDEFSRRSMKLTTTLLRIKNLAKTLDRDEIFSNVLEIITKGMEAERVQLLLNDETHGQLRVLRAEGMKPSDYKDLVIPHEENSIVAFLAKQTATGSGGASAVGVKECEVDPKTKGMIGQGILKTIIAAPIYSEEKVFAIINVEKMKNADYSRDDQNLIATCADIAGLVMKNAKLYAATMDDLVSTKKLSEEQLKRNEELKGSFSRIVSPSVAEMIMQDPTNLKLEGSKCLVTVFFSDIRGFTNMSEGLDPEELVKVLNIYFTRMTDILMSLEGTLDKYVGDELMALFGAPVSRPDDAIRAVLCAVLMIQELRKIQAEFQAEGKPVFSIGIGINSGEVTAGFMGSEKQLSYTVIGDNVNLGARLCSAAKKEEIIIAKSTYELCSEYFNFEALEPIMVKGKSKPIEIFRVLGVREGANLEEVLGANKNLGTLSLASSGTSTTPPKATAADRRSSAAMDMGGDNMTQNIQFDNKPKVIECSNCGNENDLQTKFCTKCGMPIF